jgi:mevalonate kinase
VLKGAKAIAFPTKHGQELFVEPSDKKTIKWNSRIKNEDWFSAKIRIKKLRIETTTDTEIATRLVEILKEAKHQNPDFLKSGCKVRTNIEFDKNWGLGTSSTLIANIATWANCDPYEINRKVFKGSGYDIACAESERPIMYQLNDGNEIVKKLDFHPLFANKLSFVWLNKKKNTREAIGNFDQTKNYNLEVNQVNEISENILKCTTLIDFQKLLTQHETIISKLINRPRIQEEFFSDFEGVIKSLGAWGGDFVMVASYLSFEEVEKYFNQKGFHTVLTFNNLFNE